MNYGCLVSSSLHVLRLITPQTEYATGVFTWRRGNVIFLISWNRTNSFFLLYHRGEWVGGGFIKIKSEGPDALLFFLKLWVLVAMTTSSTPGCHGHVGGFHGHIIRSSLPWTHHPVLIAMDASVFSTDTSSTPRYLGHIIRSWLPWIHPPGLVAIDI